MKWSEFVLYSSDRQYCDPGRKLLVSVHPTAIVDVSADIGSNVDIGERCRIGANVSIGDNTYIGEGTTVREGTKIGSGVMISERCHIGANVSIGDCCRIDHCCNIAAREPTNRCNIGHYASIEAYCTILGCQFAERVTVREHTVVTNVTAGAHTCIGDHSVVNTWSLAAHSAVGDHVCLPALGRYCNAPLLAVRAYSSRYLGVTDRTVTAVRCGRKTIIIAGCFVGTLREFNAALSRKYFTGAGQSNQQLGRAYRAEVKRIYTLSRAPTVLEG